MRLSCRAGSPGLYVILPCWLNVDYRERLMRPWSKHVTRTWCVCAWNKEAAEGSVSAGSKLDGSWDPATIVIYELQRSSSSPQVRRAKSIDFIEIECLLYDSHQKGIVYWFPTVPEYTMVAVIWFLLHKKLTYLSFPPDSIKTTVGQLSVKFNKPQSIRKIVGKWSPLWMWAFGQTRSGLDLRDRYIER